MQGILGGKIILTANARQEIIEDTKALIWRMCVSYHTLNRKTKPFMYPIPRCADAIEDLDLHEIVLMLHWFLALDCRQGFHQLWIRFCDQENTAFSTTDSDK
jgi:hypothetical protein